MMIGTNNTVMLAYNNLSATNKAMEKTARALSTGLRAATAADDASGFAIGMNISANIAGVSRAIRNAQDGMSMLQTAEGGLDQINSMLQRMRELSIQAANDTLTMQDRNYIQMEINELRENINNTAHNTTFNSKRLLDGSSAAVWSSDNDATKLKVSGALTALDQFGQKKSADGNYRIEINAIAGQGQVQKSSPMLISHKDVAMDRSIDTTTGVNSLKISNLPAGHYTITDETPSEARATLTGSYGIDIAALDGMLKADVKDAQLTANASILFEVEDASDGTVSLRATGRLLHTDGTTENVVRENITLMEGKSINLGTALGLGGDDAFSLTLDNDTAANFEAGYKFVYNLNVAAGTGGTDRLIVNTLSQESDNIEQRFGLDASEVMNKNLNFRSFYLDSTSGQVYDSSVILTTDDDTELAAGSKHAEFEASYVGQIPEYDVSLRDISTFYNAESLYMFDTPQKITVTQGDGKQTTITIYAEDTVEDLRAKLNDAIADGLGQKFYTDNRDNFVSFVREGMETSGGSEAVSGTFVIRSAVAGSAGKITLSSDNNDLINALGLNTITSASENRFTASVYDAHTGGLLAGNIEVTGNSIRGVISPNAEIEFDSMANVKAVWNDKTKSYDLSKDAGAYNTTIHISDRSTSFQVGSRDGEDMYINIADMRAEALGLNRVDVSTRERASESIAVLDNAIRKVSIQRTRIGAYQNELEYNYNNLTQTNLHLQESESRIKDADMAKEMMQFIKLQILSNTGSSMLASANQNSQAVIDLISM